MSYDYKLARQALRAAVEEANQLLAEIHSLGCLVKDVDLGLVDFPARLNGEPVLLCWRLGEPRVAYYHGEHEGFRGRKPIPPARGGGSASCGPAGWDAAPEGIGPGGSSAGSSPPRWRRAAGHNGSAGPGTGPDEPAGPDREA